MTTIAYVSGKMNENVFAEKMTNIKQLNLEQCWEMVNRIDDFQKLAIANAWLLKANISITDYNDLMLALTYISRELYHRK